MSGIGSGMDTLRSERNIRTSTSSTSGPGPISHPQPRRGSTGRMVVGGGIADDTQHHGICSLGNLRLHDAGCVRKFIRVKGQENEGSTATVGWKLEEVAKDTPRQSDDVSSGIFRCVFAKRIYRRRPDRGRPFDVKMAPALRRGP